MQTRRTTVRRQPRRAAYDTATVYAILDEALVCHLGLAVDGQPVVVPTLHVRVGDCLYVHGSAASRTLVALGAGPPVCVTVTLTDGLVLARSAFHHSVNYRSVVVLGHAHHIDAHHEKLAALAAFTERVAPGRWGDVRKPTIRELRATSVVAIPLAEASAKVRMGPLVDEPADYARATWAGVIPVETRHGRPVPDPQLSSDIVLPSYLTTLNR